MEYEHHRGAAVPTVGLGTWRLTGDPCYEMDCIERSSFLRTAAGWVRGRLGR
jgi:hypothetical protein